MDIIDSQEKVQSAEGKWEQIVKINDIYKFQYLATKKLTDILILLR